MLTTLLFIIVTVNTCVGVFNLVLLLNNYNRDEEFSFYFQEYEEDAE